MLLLHRNYYCCCHIIVLMMIIRTSSRTLHPPLPPAAAAITHDARHESEHRERPSDEQILCDERRELQVGGGEPHMDVGCCCLADFDALDARGAQAPNQSLVRETEADDGGGGLLVLDLNRRPDARDVQELEVVEPFCILSKQSLALHPRDGVGFYGVQRQGGGVGEREDQGGKGFGREARRVHEEQGAEDN